MGLGTLLLLALGLSMDAFAVSISKGLALHKITVGNAVLIGLWFGGFQALMPLVGFFLGVQFESAITSVDHWIAFGLLTFIGGKMLWEAFAAGQEKTNDSLSFGNMFVLAVATSIDALAVGVTFAFLKVEIFMAVALIGATTFIVSMAGVKMGSIFGIKYKARAEMAGGLILILLGTKILLEHLGVL